MTVYIERRHELHTTSTLHQSSGHHYFNILLTDSENNLVIYVKSSISLRVGIISPIWLETFSDMGSNTYKCNRIRIHCQVINTNTPFKKMYSNMNTLLFKCIRIQIRIGSTLYLKLKNVTNGIDYPGPHSFW